MGTTLAAQTHVEIDLDDPNELLPHDDPRHPHHHISASRQETVTWYSNGPFTIKGIRQIPRQPGVSTNPKKGENPFHLNPQERVATRGTDGIFRVNSGPAKLDASDGRFKINFQRPGGPLEDPDVFVDP